MINYPLQEAYFKKLTRISQWHNELKHKDAGQLFDIACDMESGKIDKEHKIFKWITQ